MATLTIELPSHQAQTTFNLRRWAELLADAELVKFEGRIETDRHGHIIMSPPPAPSHGSYQAGIALYFNAGAQELRLCASSGAMRFLARGAPHPVESSQLCPAFPKQVELS